MALNFGRDVRLLSLLMLIVLVGMLSGMQSEAWMGHLGWEERAPGLNDIFQYPASGSSMATAAGQADHHQPFSADHVHPFGLPAGPSAPHSLYPLPDCYPSQTTAEERPAESEVHGLDMSFASDVLFGLQLGEPQDLESLDYLLKLLRDGTPGPHSLAAVGVSQADSGVPQVLDRQVHTTAGAGPPDMPAVSEYKFPPSSVATSGPNQMVQPVVKTLKPQTLRGTRKRKERSDNDQLESLDIPLPSRENQWPQLFRMTPAQGGLVFPQDFFVPNNPSNPLETWEVRLIRTNISQHGSLVIPEDKFFMFYKKYIELNKSRSGVMEKSYSAKRRTRMAKKVRNFLPHCKQWYQHWFDETGIDFEKNLLQPHFRHIKRVGLFFPLFLFYVEMISSIVPREEKITLATELEGAQDCFNILTTALMHQSLGNYPQTIAAAVKRLRAELCVDGAKAINTIIWTFLEFWMVTCWRKEVFHDPESTSDALSSRIKEFFNNVFYHSYSAQHQMYIHRIYSAHYQPHISMLNI
ncbi:hypothetical protein PtA15_5A798 [Puccinia triticina]|uniref:Uncharacterized protein n=1 Tax=Puccinia triticina TaxID=208348 RepID=A0ABY7CKN5_9BASI|nr:uncharacterized protein PtA15_5A798 [Puccinia triticina]WAQ85224.1 hypothetical protein PtA15_5A798 [Puccinia triticina]